MTLVIVFGELIFGEKIKDSCEAIDIDKMQHVFFLPGKGTDGDGVCSEETSKLKMRSMC